MTTTYTYGVNTSSPVSGLSVKDVAIERLTHDGHEFELRREANGAWQIYLNSHRGWKLEKGWAGKKLLVSFAPTEEEAWEELAPLIVFADWRGVPEAMTDDDYERMLKEIEE